LAIKGAIVSNNQTFAQTKKAESKTDPAFLAK